MKTKLYLFVVTIVVILSACEGDDGPVGPQGPAGTNGTNGAANITNTTFTATAGTWNGGPNSFNIAVPVPALTDATKDFVQVYVQDPNTSDWWGLPLRNFLFVGDYNEFSFVTGTVTLWYIYSIPPASDLNYRIVVIPPALARPNVDYTNYSQVKAEYNLTD